MNTLLKDLCVSLPHNRGNVDFLIKEQCCIIVMVHLNVYDKKQRNSYKERM